MAVFIEKKGRRAISLAAFLSADRDAVRLMRDIDDRAVANLVLKCRALIIVLPVLSLSPLVSLITHRAHPGSIIMLCFLINFGAAVTVAVPLLRSTTIELRPSSFILDRNASLTFLGFWAALFFSFALCFVPFFFMDTTSGLAPLLISPPLLLVSAVAFVAYTGLKRWSN